MKALTTIILTSFFLSANAQEIGRRDSSSRKDYEWLNKIIEKQEKSATINLSDKDYSNHYYRRFEGKILVINETSIKYDDKVLIISNTSRELRKIFEVGLLYPSIFAKSEPDSSTIKELSDSTMKYIDTSVVTVNISRKKYNFFFNNADSITVSDFKEQKNMSKSSKTRVFEFLLFYKGFANPAEYTIELTNDNATNDTNLDTFINGARLTLVIKGSILI